MLTAIYFLRIWCFYTQVIFSQGLNFGKEVYCQLLRKDQYSHIVNHSRRLVQVLTLQVALVSVTVYMCIGYLESGWAVTYSHFFNACFPTWHTATGTNQPQWLLPSSGYNNATTMTTGQQLLVRHYYFFLFKSNFFCWFSYRLYYNKYWRWCCDSRTATAMSPAACEPEVPSFFFVFVLDYSIIIL